MTAIGQKVTRSSLLWLAGLGLALSVQADTPPAAGNAARVDAYGDPLPAGAVARLGTIRWRHNNTIIFVAYSPDGKEIVTVCQDGIAHVWDAASGKKLRRFGKADIAAVQIQAVPQAMAVRTEGTAGVALSPEGNTLAVGSSNGSITLWGVATGKEVRSFKTALPTGANSLLFALDGKSLFARGSDAVLRQYDVAEGKEVRKFGAVPRPRAFMSFTQGRAGITPDGKSLVLADIDYNDNQFSTFIKSWDVASGKELSSGKGPALQLNLVSIAFAPDGKTVAWGHYSGTHLWDVATGKEIRKLDGPQRSNSTALAFSPDGKWLAVRGGDQTVRIWDVATGKELHRLGEPIDPLLTGVAVIGLGRGWVTSDLAFSPDGKLLATTTPANKVRQWDVQTGQELEVRSGDR